MFNYIKLSLVAIAAVSTVLTSCSEESTSPKTNDTTPPKITFTKPLNNQEFDIGATVEVLIEATDSESGISSVNFIVDGKDVLSDKIAPYELYWNTKDEKSGRHIIKVIAADKDKNSNSTEISIILKENIGYTEIFTEGLKGANGLVMANDGFLYVSNSGDKTITKIAPDGGKTQFTGIECPELNGIMVTQDNTFYAACGAKVVKIDKNGSKTLIADGFKKANSIIGDNSGNIYVLDALDNKIVKITPDGSKSDFITGIAFNYTKDKLLATNMIFDKEYKNIYVSAVIDNKIYKYPVNQDGSAGSKEVFAAVQGPNYLAIDKDNNVFATTFYDASLVKIENSVPKNIAKGMFSSPCGIVFGSKDFSSNSLYIADNTQNKIFRVFVGSSAII